MKVIIDVNKDTSKLLTDLIDKLNSTKMSDLDKSRNRLESMVHELENQLADTPEKDELIEFFNECIDDDEKLVTIDKDPNIIDNKTLININTRKMNKKDLIKQELGEIESILKNKAYSQLLAKYHARLFSEVEGLEGEDVQEIKDRLDDISDQLEEISNSEVVTDESVEVTDEVTEESPEEPEAAEEASVDTEASTEEATEEVATEEESTEEVEETTEETTEEESVEEESATEESEVKTESDDQEHLEEIAEQAEESEKVDKEAIKECMAEIDEAMEELREAVETKDFSKVIARHYNRLFSEVESHQDLIENIDEVKEAMDDLAEKIEKLDAEADEDSEDKHEGEEKEVEDAEHAEEEAHDAKSEAEVKTESEDCWVLVKDGKETSTKGTKEEIKAQLDEFGPADRPHYEMKQCAKCCSDEESSDDAEVVTEEKVEATPEVAEEKSEVPSEQEIKAIAEQAAEEAVYEQLENGLFMNEIDDQMPGEAAEVTEDADAAATQEVSGTEAIVSEEVPEKEAEVEPMYIDEKTEMVLDPMETEEVLTASDDLADMEDDELILDEVTESDFCNKTFSRGTSQFLGEMNTDKYAVASIEELIGY